jgi:hypothetical protein
MAPIVDDACPPATVDTYTKEDLAAFSLRELYVRSCAKLNVKPAEQITEQLASEPGDHHQVTALNVAKLHLGRRRCAALVPVIAACPRLTHLHMATVGLDASVAKALVAVFAVHPGISYIDISGNDLGANVGDRLLRLVREHRRIHTLNVSHCLLVRAVLDKIRRQVEANYAIRDQFSVPLIPDKQPSPADVAAAKMREEQERLREARLAAERERLAEEIPPWAPAALLELHQTLHKHRRHVLDVFSVFKTDAGSPGDALVTPKNFVRAMAILDVRSIADAQRACELADLFQAWDRKEDRINFHAVVAAVRVHAAIVAGPNATNRMDKDGPVRRPPRRIAYLFDAVHDSRSSLRRGFETIDVDMTGTVDTAEMIVGICAVTDAPDWHVRDVLRVCCVELPRGTEVSPAEDSAAAEAAAAAVTYSDEEETPVAAADDDDDEIPRVPLPDRISYDALFDAVGIAAADDEALPRPTWEMTRSELRAVAAAATR